MKRVANEPSDGDVDLRFTHQPPVMDDAKQETRKHEAQRNLRVNSWAPVVFAVEIGDLSSQPGEIKHLINTRKYVITGHELSKRAGHEQL